MYKYYLIILIFTFSCNNGPKIIESSVEDTGSSTGTRSTSTGIFSSSTSDVATNTAPNSQVGAVSTDVHSVKVKEVLPTEKYVYLLVTENEEEFWIATGKQEVKVGETYFYKGGLLKTNFESKEYNRVFDKVYLVSNLVLSNHGMPEKTVQINNTNAKSTTDSKSKQDFQVEGSTKIAELVKNPTAYEGKEIQLSGECVKINPNIMGRNWIHLQDGSQDDYDLVITSQIPVPEGHLVTMKGIVRLNQDFGAGYRYDIIIEDAVVVN